MSEDGNGHGAVIDAVVALRLGDRGHGRSDGKRKVVGKRKENRQGDEGETVRDFSAGKIGVVGILGEFHARRLRCEAVHFIVPASRETLRERLFREGEAEGWTISLLQPAETHTRIAAATGAHGCE